MLTRCRITLGLLYVAELLGPVQAQQEPPIKVDAKLFNVRSFQESGSPSTSYTGVVEAIDKEKMILRCAATVELSPVDLLAQGKLVKSADDSMTYRWQDVKKGDTVRVETMFDEGEQKRYALEIGIERRPGAKLPRPPEWKDGRAFTRSSLLNDIVNGEDVSDEAIAKAFPPKATQHPITKEIFSYDPGGLDEKYQKLLYANRKRIAEEKAKKEKELKAKPTEKKDDKR
jgi:hypothetical protein